ncbi:MAG: hypothetical protein E7430_00520 [Ruminococcaceae bacterium]|nr:hypothetical protein [Oscillospiraceae bacterium]
MSDFEDKLNAVLNDPDSMAQIMKLAQSIGEKNDDEEQLKDHGPEIGKILSMAGQLGSTESKYSALLYSLKPYLKEERQRKLERAIRISKLSKLAKTALESGLIGEL